MASILDLPCELILMVLDYVPSRDVWQNVRLTCRMLANIVSDRRYWKRRLWKGHGVELPSCQLQGPVSSLSFSCAKTEEEKDRWRSGILEEPVSASGHDATVDTVGLMKSSAHKRLCISGARDRALVLWDTDAVARKMDKEIWRLCHVPEAHQGWIWNLCKGDNDIFYSCAWDRYVKQWQIGNGCINRICDVQMASAALCVVNDGAVTICSTFGRRVIALDARNSLQKIADMLYHRSAVFHLVQDSGSNYLYSCGEDRRIVCVDKRMWKVINELQLKAYAQTISLRQGQLLCGNVKGQLLSVDPTSLKILNEVSIENNGPIRQVRLNAGTQMCISKYRVFKVFTPGLRPKLLAESPKFDIDLTRFDYYDGTLAVACSNGCVMFWS